MPNHQGLNLKVRASYRAKPYETRRKPVDPLRLPSEDLFDPNQGLPPQPIPQPVVKYRHSRTVLVVFRCGRTDDASVECSETRRLGTGTDTTNDFNDSGDARQNAENDAKSNTACPENKNCNCSPSCELDDTFVSSRVVRKPRPVQIP